MNEFSQQAIFSLDQRDLPTSWINILPDLPVPLPEVLHPLTKKPMTPDDLAPLFSQALIEQEFSQERHIEIPKEVLDILKIWRPTTLHRAFRLEKALGTPARIFYKYEGSSPAGSHKMNTAIAQAYYNKEEGIRRLTTETGAGQWGNSLAIACAMFDLECMVYMVASSFYHKPYRRYMMETWGARCIPSPSQETLAGKEALKQDPASPGSLGLAISEAVEDALLRDDTRYTLGSVLNHVLLHQTIIGQEAMAQMAMTGFEPDILIGCVGGGSNFGGLVIPFVRDKIKGERPDLRIIGAESSSCPTLTKGLYAYDYGDVAGLTPILKMFTLGHRFMPPPSHSGGLRYHGMAPIVGHLKTLDLIEATAIAQREAFEAGILFARTEGTISAPEANHAIAATIREAMRCKENNEAKTILFNLSGHGHVDMVAYEQFLSGKLKDIECPEKEIDEALKALPAI
jgi:tryptophan synthase beta chain